ncbi:hypothetical protein ACGFLS_21920 [Streptomyces abikoensis]|uniref:hypothetical protein n=1 Tax=Streptomyces abikoensis TaxID=97398 RepID=UPI003723B29F
MTTSALKPTLARDAAARTQRAASAVRPEGFRPRAGTRGSLQFRFSGTWLHDGQQSLQEWLRDFAVKVHAEFRQLANWMSKDCRTVAAALLTRLRKDPGSTISFMHRLAALFVADHLWLTLLLLPAEDDVQVTSIPEHSPLETPKPPAWLMGLTTSELTAAPPCSGAIPALAA